MLLLCRLRLQNKCRCVRHTNKVNIFFQSVCVRWTVHTVGGRVVRVALGRGLGGVQELLVAHVAFAAAEEDVGTLLPLHALVTAKGHIVGVPKTAEPTQWMQRRKIHKTTPTHTHTHTDMQTHSVIR